MHWVIFLLDLIVIVVLHIEWCLLVSKVTSSTAMAPSVELWIRQLLITSATIATLGAPLTLALLKARGEH